MSVPDADWIKFTIPESDGPSQFVIETRGIAGGNTTVRLYTADGVSDLSNPLAMDTNSGVGFYSRLEMLIGNELQPGEYFVSITNAGQKSDVSYQLLVQQFPIADQFDRGDVNDDTREEATEHDLEHPTNAQATFHSFHSSDDVDWVFFEVSEFSSFDMRTIGTPDGDTKVTLFDANGIEIASDDNGGWRNYSRITLNGEDGLRPNGPSPATYFLKVENIGGNILEEYRLQVLVTPKADQFERNPSQPQQAGTPSPGFDDDRNNATPIFFGQQVFHSLHTASDQDWFTFFLPAAAVVTIDTFGPAGGDTRIVLFGPDDPNQRAPRNSVDDDSGVGDYARLIRRNDARLPPGQYWFRVDSPTGTILDSYGVTITGAFIPQTR
jgi:hypothetical protein